jgi:chitinase
MTMDYGGSKGTSSMKEATQLSLNSTWMQLDALFKRAGTPKTEAEIWGMIGATPMIGQNDVPDEVFTVEDAQWLNDFAHRMGMGRISFWSANRDAQCGDTGPDSRVSNTCSGVRQDPHQFTNVLTAASATGKPPSTNDAALFVQASTTPLSRAQNLSHDDPRTSPYPLWRMAKEYDAGSKVVWQDRVYQAKWWNKDTQPDAPVVNTWDTPWRYLGPVLQSDRDAAAAAIPIAPSAERATWSSEKVYVAGDEVESFGRAYRAKWWTQGDLPQQDPNSPFDHPWQYLGEVVKAAATQAPPPPGYTPQPATPTPDAQGSLRFTPRNSYIYTILPGDTITSNALKYGVTAADIMAVNRNIKSPDQLAVGDRVLIPLPYP